MKLLITGGCGFIGSNFIRYIIKKYKTYKVINLDKLTYCGRRENLKDVEKNERYSFIKGDICNAGLVEQLTEKCDAIINFAAESHVDKSIKDASCFVRTNVCGVQVLLEAARKHKLKKIVQISCYDKKTRALTTEGLKSYRELKKGDRVFSLNPDTMDIEIKPIEKVIIQSYKGKMAHFNNQRVDLLVTPNHNMFIMNTSKEKKRMIIETAEESSKRSIFYMPEGYWKGKDEKWFDVKGHRRVKTEDLMYILGIFIGDGFTAYQEKEIETKTGLNRREYLKKCKDEATGRFKVLPKESSYKTNCHSYRIFFDIPIKDKCRLKVENTLRRLGIKYSCHKGKAGEHIYITSKHYSDLFNQCGKGAHNKHIPRWALSYSIKYLEYLLNGLMDSDGSKGKIYHTVSKRLAYDIAELCVKLNLKPVVRKRHSVSFFEGRKIEGDCYYVFVATTAKSISRHRNKLVNYNDEIWCLKVKDNKNFLVERNGRFDFCGNTDEVYGSIQKGSFNEKSLLHPNSPYAASKAGGDHLAMSYYATFKMPIVITRSSNNFGPYQFPEKVIPLFITNLLENKKVPLYGDGLNVRDWLYVMDNCKAIDLIFHKGKVGEIYNIGGCYEIPNIKLTSIILKMLNKKNNMIKYVPDRLGHDRRYSLDSTKIRRLGWRPTKDFNAAIEETIEWYKDNRTWWNKIK